MFQKFQFAFLLLLTLGFATSCDHHVDCFEGEGNEASPSTMLTDGIWDLGWVRSTEIAGGQAIETNTEAFGEGTTNGVCTFEFQPELECIMIDVGGEQINDYRVFENGDLRIGGTTYRIQNLSADVLEILAFESHDCEEGSEGIEELMHFNR
ncbi:MAG: hypothetical protein AAGN35_18695 [Bacteroidota bacterium]